MNSRPIATASVSPDTNDLPAEVNRWENEGGSTGRPGPLATSTVIGNLSKAGDGATPPAPTVLRV